MSHELVETSVALAVALLDLGALQRDRRLIHADPERELLELIGKSSRADPETSTPMIAL